MLALVSIDSMAATPWQNLRHPIAGTPQSIGAFTNGCIIGAQALPSESRAYQILRPDQYRYYGHPELLQFIQRLSDHIYQSTQRVVLVGDMGMPAGGRFSSGHASHQSGLDVDIWLQLPVTRWTPEQLLQPQPLDLVDERGRQIVAARWQSVIGAMIKQAAEDHDVTRIFVHPAIKQQLCREAGQDRRWLQKVRPWFGHRAHMHVRLRCPAGSQTCESQVPPPPGDGCGAELQSWFIPKRPATGNSIKREPPPLPAGCQALLDDHLL